MALTPEDVVNKRFQPTKFREGYDQDEVDDFLDEIVVELRRLTAENEELRKKLDAASQAAPAASAASAPAAPLAVPVAASPEAQTSQLDDAQSSNNMLVLARRLHDEHVKEGVDKRDALISEAHKKATEIISEAEGTANDRITKANAIMADLESKITELRAFESDYRRQLRTYIEGQLGDLDALASPVK